MTHFAGESSKITHNNQFETTYVRLIQALLLTEPVARGAAHAMKDDTTSSTHELMHVTQSFDVSADIYSWQRVILPNLPWAEDHFQERVSGEPLNPAPSEQWWPFARQGNAEHKKDEVFSHTYPERFWPRYAGEDHGMEWTVSSPNGRARHGIRFFYGDLNTLVEVLRSNPMSRQAYLPIWFPEDIHAASFGERVPCSLGYHFIMVQGRLDCVYTLRSCDIVRFYRDDMYMAGRLLQWVSEKVNAEVGRLVVHIDNLHCFPNDRPFLEAQLPATSDKPVDARASYNYGAMM